MASRHSAKIAQQEGNGPIYLRREDLRRAARLHRRLRAVPQLLAGNDESRDCTNIRPCRIFDFGTMVDHGNMVVGLYARPCYGRIWSNIRIFLNSDRSRLRKRGRIPWLCNPWFKILFTPSLLHSPIFDAGFLNVGEGVNKMGNSRETREIKSLVLTHSFLYFTLA